MKQMRWLIALLAVFAMVAVACGSDDGGGETAETTTTEAPSDSDEPDDADEPDDEPEVTVAPTTEPPAPDEVTGVDGGRLVWVHEQDPGNLDLDNPANGLTIQSWIIQSMLEGAYGISSEIAFVPELLAGPGELVENEDGTFTITYTLRDGLMWSDGSALTSADFEYTFNTYTAGCGTEDDGTIVDNGDETCEYASSTYQGYDKVSSFDVISDTQFSMTMVEFFAGWEGLFERVFPSSLGLSAADMQTAFATWTHNGEPLPSSGPMTFVSYDEGVNLVLARNENYHGSVSARNDGVAIVDEVEIRFVGDTDAQVNALLSGEAQVITAQPQTQFEQLSTNEDFTVEVSVGPIWEHWGFNSANVHLAKPNVREALAFALDKAEVVETLYQPLFGEVLPSDGLGNVYWLTSQADYVDQQAEYGGAQADAAAAKLEEAGYALNGDGIYEHPDDGVLTLRVGTTGGNRLRELQQQIIQAQMATAGIDIVIDNVPGGAYFGERPFSGDPTVWDITQFAWVGGPWPGSGNIVFLSDGGFNVYGFGSEGFDTKINECEVTQDAAARAACYNEASEFVTTLKDENGLRMIPLTQKPTFYGYRSDQLNAAGVFIDANAAGPLINVVDYQFAG